jgi:AcrR family transcriptional regulator
MSSSEAASELRAVDGRVPGRRGRATRDRLLRCTSQLLEKTSFRDLTVIEIAQCAECSPATFYQYFPDVESAILVLAGDAAEEGLALAELICDSNWHGAATDSAGRLVDGFLELWEEHRTVLRVVDLATAEGDSRFANVRTSFLNEITGSLRDVIAGFQRGRRHGRDVDPTAQAAALVSMLAHVAAHRWGFEFWGIKIEHVRDSVARLVEIGVAGAPAAAPGARTGRG